MQHAGKKAANKVNFADCRSDYNEKKGQKAFNKMGARKKRRSPQI
jgi:hypothetical protein